MKTRRTASGCLEFTGTHVRDGYGTVGYGQAERGGRLADGRRGVVLLAHRVVWERHNGPIPEGMVVMHSCDNPPCVELGHLSLGTHADNARDKVERRRAVYGDRNGRTRHSFETVQEMRRVYEAGGVSMREVSRRYGMEWKQAMRVLRGERRVDA